MMSIPEIAIKVSNLSKMYKIYNKPADMFWELLKGEPRYKPFWALSNVSFQVKRGQVVGVLGRNGAGKSTLLKIITGTLDRTAGDVQVSGRVSSILELGTGFNMEYTGRDNIYLGGLMVGLTRDEIKQKEDWIIEFSELQDFIDQPFKTYSTGMQARLTFATAVCIDPDILIIDEALAVGDAKFQRKSFSQIEQFRKAGHTILLVSHDINTISTFCDHAVLLENGRVFNQGEPYRIGQVYYKMLFAQDAEPVAMSASPDVEELAKLPVEIPLDKSQIAQENGYAWWLNLSDVEIEGDTIDKPQCSVYVLCEDDVPLRPGHSAHYQIRQFGKGAYSHWNKVLYFSTSDGSDPRVNVRRYVLRRKDLVNSAAVTPIPLEAVKNVHEIPERLEIRRTALAKLCLAKPFVPESAHLMRMGNKKAEILDFGILDDQGLRVRQMITGAHYTLFFRAVFYVNVDTAGAGFLIRDIKGVDIYGISTKSLGRSAPGRQKGEILEARLLVYMYLTNGTYFLTVNVNDLDAVQDAQYDSWFDGYQFEVMRKPGIFHNSVVDLNATLELSTVSRL
jgi:ABC-type polysaccharide/polyol phosphate transport system ATPase subunit